MFRRSGCRFADKNMREQVGGKLQEFSQGDN
jgi:hypothetical protein